MKIKKLLRGYYVLIFNDLQKFLVCKNGYPDFPWNVFSWCDSLNCFPNWEFCVRTKKEAIEQLLHQYKGGAEYAQI